MKNYEVSEGVMIYYLPRELDHFAAEKMKRESEGEFEKQELHFLIFDFEKTVFMDSSGIGLITGRYRKIHDQGGKVFALHVSESIDKVLMMSGIYRIIQKKSTKEEIVQEMLKGGCYE